MRFRKGERIYDNDWGAAIVVGYFDTCCLLRYDKDPMCRDFAVHPERIDFERGGLVLRSLDIVTRNGDGI